MVPRALRRSLVSRGIDGVLAIVPATYRLGPGHVSFFYDKGLFLRARYAELTVELHRRGVQYDRDAVLDSLGVYRELPPAFHRGYQPTVDALHLSRARITERLAARPGWYRHRGRPI